ncbi:MAG: hypothetical protein IPF52_16385 [Saprospiraceae bacterium]|nr:hypothetical protein [Saprospiraceae bacterium]
MSRLIQPDEDTKKFLGEESYRNKRFYINPVIKELGASIKNDRGGNVVNY